MIKFLVWFQLCMGAANNHAVECLEYFGSAEQIYNSSEQEREKSGLFSKAELERMKKISLIRAIKIIKECEENSIKLIPFGSKVYPRCLSVIEDPPLLLYVKGRFPDFDNTPSITVVGPRNVSEYGKKAAYSLSFRLAKAGFTIVSGGALGTDTFAHSGAIKAGGNTVLVMGCGIASNYLKRNEKLRDYISRFGCLISEFPPKAQASKYTFPIRNRIMSALSLGTVVIEAGVKSGALITARLANEQGRDVFVIIGSADLPEYKGSNALLRDGAKAVLDASDIFNEYIIRFPDKINIERAYETPIIASKKDVIIEKCEKNKKILNETLSKEAKIVYNNLDKQKFLPEEITDTGLSSQQLLAALTELEMELVIKALPGGMYELCN